MKRPIQPTYTFNPGGATLNLSGITGFALGSLFAVVNLRTGALVYAPTPGYGATANGTVLTLQAPMAGHGAADALMILYDDGGKPAEDASVQQLASAVQQGLQNDQTAIGALTANATWQAALLSATQAITAALKAQVDASGLFVSDGTGTYVRRESINEGTGTITVAFENLDGSAATPNVSALAPITAKSRVATPVYYDVVVATGAYALTDVLAEVVITDTVTGGITATWQNLTQATTLTAPPPSSNVKRSSSAVSLPTGQKTAANSLSVVLSSDGPFATNFGSTGDGPAPDDTSAASFMALFRRGLVRWSSLLAVLPASRGAKAGAASFPVVLASDQAAIPNPSRLVVTGTLANSGDVVVLPVDGMNTAFLQLLGTASWSATLVFEVSGDGGATWSATNLVPWAGGAPVAGIGAGAANVPQLFEAACGGPTHMRVRATTAIGNGPVAVVAAAASGLKSLRVGSVDGGFVTLGSQADAAASADVGAFSLVSLVKRGLGRWTTLLGLLPQGLGRATMAGSFPVVLASDQAAVPVTTGKAATAGDASVAAGGTAQTLFAGATPANGWKVANPDPAEDLWVSDSATAAPNGQGSYRLPAGGILTTEPGERPCGPVSVYGATAGHGITARSW